MSEPLLTETAIISNTATNPATIATTVTVRDPSTGECPKPPFAFRELVFPLSFYAAPAPVPAPGPLMASMPTSTSSTTHEQPIAYDIAIARVQLLHTFLTPSMRCTLTSMLYVMNMHPPPPEGLATHALIARVASPEQTPDHCIKDIVDVIEKGLRIFAALGGGSVKKPESEVRTAQRAIATTSRTLTRTTNGPGSIWWCLAKLGKGYSRNSSLGWDRVLIYRSSIELGVALYPYYFYYYYHSIYALYP